MLPLVPLLDLLLSRVPFLDLLFLLLLWLVSLSRVQPLLLLLLLLLSLLLLSLLFPLSRAVELVSGMRRRRLVASKIFVSAARRKPTTPGLLAVLRLIRTLLTMRIYYGTTLKVQTGVVDQIPTSQVICSGIASNVLFVSVNFAIRKRLYVTDPFVSTDFVLLGWPRNQLYRVPQQQCYCRYQNHMQQRVCQQILQIESKAIPDAPE